MLFVFLFFLPHQAKPSAWTTQFYLDSNPYTNWSRNLKVNQDVEEAEGRSLRLAAERGQHGGSRHPQLVRGPPSLAERRLGHTDTLLEKAKDGSKCGGDGGKRIKARLTYFLFLFSMSLKPLRDAMG